MELVLTVLGVLALIGALPSLVVAGVPLYLVGNIAAGDPLFLSGSALVFGLAYVTSVLINAALLELLIRRRTVGGASRASVVTD
ncbi:hypothetical protein GCM10023153_07260 [Ornithinibacter aureus]|uniref:Uncharacterized protein n=2 Tax=Ornithinibacter aureus TaxID=622664 RepID=A0ABP8JG18_9MICO|nr:hypothetical protein C8E84_0162 [Ornithinibacter aureus]